MERYKKYIDEFVEDFNNGHVFENIVVCKMIPKLLNITLNIIIRETLMKYKIYMWEIITVKSEDPNQKYEYRMKYEIGK